MTKRILLILVLVIGVISAYFYLTYPDVEALQVSNPQSTALMEVRAGEARELGMEARRVQTWVPIERISREAVRAVLAGEDSRFFEHDGFDYDALKDAAEENWEKGKIVRGGSTITQQLAKNLYLSESKNPVRKLQEAMITRSLEQALSKWRILEIYLNVIEWGDGIYGIEAAAQTYFKKPASRLSRSEAARLAAMIPNPRTVYNPAKNPRNVARRQRAILRGMTGISLPRQDRAR